MLSCLVEYLVVRRLGKSIFPFSPFPFFLLSKCNFSWELPDDLVEEGIKKTGNGKRDVEQREKNRKCA